MTTPSRRTIAAPRSPRAEKDSRPLIVRSQCDQIIFRPAVRCRNGGRSPEPFPSYRNAMMRTPLRRIAASMLIVVTLTVAAAVPAQGFPLLVVGAARAVAVTDVLFLAASTAGVRAVAAGAALAVAGSGMATVSAVPRVVGASLAGVASTPLIVQGAIVGNHTALIGGMLVPVVAVANAVGK